MPGAALLLRIQNEWVRVPAHKELLLSVWRRTLTIKHVNVPKDYSTGMNTERGKATAFPPARAPASPEERRQKENITYFPVALATHTHEEESP